VSDTVSNSIRVVKTSKQAATEAVTYPAVIRDIVAKDGVLGLFGRGLKTKILANGLQARDCAASALTSIGLVAVHASRCGVSTMFLAHGSLAARHSVYVEHWIDSYVPSSPLTSMLWGLLLGRFCTRSICVCPCA